ncbi:hypothetical protein Q8A67_016840 [Cirrhinus molitorella]|uniref:Uncharacterized protein n=1 Tax=Cirrhinus molitorella TaxID=172907 RepID=A0AA88PMF3_9TELE|nr:hypothetical protein Q8A67_016840 [Cirrhinus molitorella]
MQPKAGEVNGWGPHGPPGGLNPAAASRSGAPCPSSGGRPPGLRRRARGRAHFFRGGAPRPAPVRPGRARGRRWSATPRTAAGFTEPSRPDSAAYPRGRVSASSRLPPPPSLGRVGGTGPPAPGVRSPGAYCPQYAPVGAAPPGRGPGPRQGRPRSAERSATHPTRLETRTKESNARASQRVSSSPHGAMKVKAFPLPGGRSPRWDPPAPAGGAPPARLVPRERGRWSESACESTRKMVNYAWAGRSQGKPWWRPAAVLTCKSVVRPGHRGERLIEPSSSWFPPKFPSG